MSLFGEDSAWSIPEPKTGSSALLEGALIPPSYTEAFNNTHPIGGFATIGALKSFLAESGITADQQETILSLIGSKGNSISHDLWNAAMALVALAQGGKQDLDLDEVDAVRHNLPDLKMPGSKPANHHGSEPSMEPSSAWHGNSASGGGDGDDLSNSSNNHIPVGDSTPWTNIDPSGYNPIAKDTIQIRIQPEKEGMFMFRHVVYVIEGTIAGVNNNNSFRVIRRYSDFLWLLECLVKMYPFRLLPVLPPKRLAVDGRYLSSDSYFLERRRRGLTRFVNQLVKHPLLKKEKLVQMFLTVDTELSSWRKNSSIQIEEEFSNRVISQQFVQQWDSDRERKKWDMARQGAEDALEILSQMVVLMDRICRRNEAMSADMKKISNAFSSLKAPLSNVYSDPEEDVSAIKEGISSVGRYTSNSTELYRDESQSVDVGVLEDVKQLRELVGGIRELFARLDKHGGNNIPQLEHRITLSERKLQTLYQQQQQTQDVDLKQVEIKKLKSSINKDKKSIQQQTNRDWLIKECITEELTLCQRTQYQISKVVRDWAADTVKYSELHQQNWSEMNDDVAHMPLI